MNDDLDDLWQHRRQGVQSRQRMEQPCKGPKTMHEKRTVSSKDIIDVFTTNQKLLWTEEGGVDGSRLSVGPMAVNAQLKASPAANKMRLSPRRGDSCSAHVKQRPEVIQPVLLKSSGKQKKRSSDVRGAEHEFDEGGAKMRRFVRPVLASRGHLMAPLERVNNEVLVRQELDLRSAARLKPMPLASIAYVALPAIDSQHASHTSITEYVGDVGNVSGCEGRLVVVAAAGGEAVVGEDSPLMWHNGGVEPQHQTLRSWTSQGLRDRWVRREISCDNIQRAFPGKRNTKEKESLQNIGSRVGDAAAADPSIERMTQNTEGVAEKSMSSFQSFELERQRGGSDGLQATKRPPTIVEDDLSAIDHQRIGSRLLLPESHILDDSNNITCGASEGHLSSSTLQDTKHLESVKIAGLGDLSPALGAEKYVRTMEAHIARELRSVADQSPDGVVGKTRLNVYKAAAANLVKHFSFYGALFERIFKEYEDYAGLAERKATAAQRHFDLMQSENDTLRSQLRDLQDALLKVEAEAAERERTIKSKVECGKTVWELVEEIEYLRDRMRTLESEGEEMRDKLSASSQVRHEFQRTVRAVEDMFQLVLDEKDFQILALKQEAAELSKQLTAVREQAHHQIVTLEDKIDYFEIENDLQKKKTSINTERVKVLEAQNIELSTALQAARGQVEDLEVKAAGYEEELRELGVNPQGGGRVVDPVLTPRPSRSEAVNNVPELVDPSVFQSTASLIAAIYAQYRQKSEQLKVSMQVESELWETIMKHKLSCYQRRRSVAMADSSTQTSVLLGVHSSNDGPDGPEG